MSNDKAILPQAALKKLIENTETISLKPTEMINLRLDLEIPKGSSWDDYLDGSFDGWRYLDLEITDRGAIRPKKLLDESSSDTDDLTEINNE